MRSVRVRGNGGKQVMGTIGIGRLGNMLSKTLMLYTTFSDDGFLIIEGMDMCLGFFR